MDVYIIAEICGPETIILDLVDTFDGAKQYKRELIERYPGSWKDAKAYGQTVAIMPYKVRSYPE